MKKQMKWVLAFCGILVLMLGLLCGCGEKEVAQDGRADLYYNIDGQTYTGTPGTVPVRRIEADGYYHIRFAHNGEQVRYPVVPELVTQEGLDLYKIVNLEFDENGVVVGYNRVDEVTGGYFVEEFFVESIEGSAVTCNSAASFLGYQKTFELAEDTKVYYVEGDGPLVGMKASVQLDDKITAVMDKEGKVYECFVKPLGEVPTVYFSKTRLYDATAKATTRESDLTGTYVFEMAVNGGPVTVKTKDATLASKMDSFAARNMILTFDEDGYVDSVAGGDATCGAWSSWCNFMSLENGEMTTLRVRAGSNQGVKYREFVARNFVAYDVSANAPVYGEVTELRKGDVIHCLKNSRGQIAIAFIVERVYPGDVYWNVSRQYDSTAKDTKRVPNADGWYEIVMTKDGQHYTLKTKDREIIRKIDAQADSHCGLEVDGDVITAFRSTVQITGGGAWASWCDMTMISEDGKKIQALRTIESSNKGTYYTAKVADDCKIYDVSGQGEYIGEFTELRLYDRVHGELNADGELGIIYVVRRLADSDMYWNVEQKYNDTTKSTTRSKWSDGYYRVLLAVNGKQVTYKVADKEVMNAIDKRPYLRSFGVKLEGNVITKVYEPGLVTGGNGWASWADITSIKDGVITAVKITDSETQKLGTVYTAKMAEDCEVYDVTELAKLDSYIGVKTKPRVGDRVYGHLNLDGEIQVLYIVGNRKVNGYVAWNFARKYDATNKVSTRVPDENGWYKVDLAVNGKQVTWKTKDKELIDKIDSMYCSGLTVNKEGVIQKHYSYHLVTGGYAIASWYDVTSISGGTITAKRILDGADKGKVYTGKLASGYKIYDVSENYVDHRGEVTKLQVGDRIHALKNSTNRDVCIVFVVSRPDKPGTPDHFHCTCGDGSFDGVGDHTCDDTTGYSAWTNPRKLPTSGNWYLATDVTTLSSYSVLAGNTVNLCLNGHTVNGSDSARIYYNAGNLTITDCKPADQQGQMIANSEQYGGVIYNTDKGATINIFAGTYKHSLEQIARSGGIFFLGEKDDNGESIMNLYGGTIIGTNSTYPGVGIAGTRKAIFNMYGGTITGGKTIDKGGNIYFASGTVNLYGGEITNGQAKVGGNVNMNNGVLNLMGTKISGGYATTDGGNIYINNTGVLNMKSGIVTGGYSANEGGNVWISDKGASMTMDGGEIVGGGIDGEGTVTTKKGGNIMNFGTLTINGGTISGGSAKSSGGNLGTYTNSCSVTINGGTISGGVAPKAGNIHVENNVTKNMTPITITGGTISNGTVVLTHATATITGGTISGGLDVLNASTLDLSGKPVISGSEDFNLRIAKGENITLGDFEEGAEIGVKSTQLNVPFGTLTDPTDKQFFSSNDPDCTLEMTEENQLYLRSVHTHCVCGTAAADGVGDHSCDDTRGWVKWTNAASLPTTAGYYYLDTDVVLTAPSWQTGLTNVYICLNGHTVTGPTDNRLFFIRGNLTLTDCKPVEEQGGVISRFDAAGSVFYVDDITGSGESEKAIDSSLTIYGGTYETDLDSLKTSGGILFLGNKALGGKTTFNMYGGTFVGTSTSASGGTIYAFRQATINMYGGTISGGKSPANGGNIYMGSGVANLYGGTISGGEAAKGGNIHVADGELNVSGATISGGYATTDGGNVFLSKGTLNVHSGLITAGACANEGGNVWINEKVAAMTMDGGKITNGGVKDGTTVTRKGGNIQNFCVLTISGGEISGGKATVSGGNIGTYTNSCDITISGGTISGGVAPKGGNINMENNVSKDLTKLAISGGTISSGTVTLSHGAATITGGTISDGLQVLGASTLNLSGTPVISGLTVSDGTKITVGDLTEGAAITMTITKTGDKVGPLTDPEDKVFFTSADEKNELLMDEENKLYQNVKPHVHCICGGAPMANAAEHTCTELTWTPISSALQAAGLTATTADFGKLPSGNYYLDSNITVTGATALVGKDLNICLNGFTVTASANATFGYGMKDGTLSITDCSYDAEAKTWAGTMKGGTMTGSIKYGGIMYLTGKQTVNIYGGNFTAKTADTPASGGGLFVVAQDNYDKANAADKSVLNIYNGRFSDAKATSGGLITVFHTCDLNIYGGTFTKGNATYGGLINSSSSGTVTIAGGLLNNALGAPANSMGGAIYITKGTLDIKGGTFVGNAAYYGGAIYAKNATAGTNMVVNIANAKFFTSPSSSTTTANRAYHDGGNIHIESTAGTATLNIKAGAEIGYGYTTNTNFANAIVAAGGNIFAKNATVNMTGGTVIGGSSINGGNIYFDGNTDAVYNLNISGGTISNGYVAHANYPNSSYKDASNKTVMVYPMGGNIHVSTNEKLVISGSAEIKDGFASHAGGNIAINFDADMQMTGGKVQGGTAAYAGNIFTNNSANVQVTISGGEITGGTLDRSKNTAGNGACFRLHTNVKLILSGTVKIDEIYFCGASTKIDATGLNALETPIAIAGSNKSVFADVTTDLSGSFSYAGGTIRYEESEGKLYADPASEG